MRDPQVGKRMIRIGVFGLIGSGKTEVSRIFEEKGAYVISADEIGREVVDTRPDVLEALKREFGTEIVDGNGNLRRRELGKRIFASEEDRKKLDSIVHPPLLDRLQELMDEAERECDSDMLVVDAALILNWGIEGDFDYLICVTASKERQLERLLSAGFTEKEARDRIGSQIPRERQAAAADFVIENDGSLDDLRQMAETLYDEISSKKID